MGVGPVPIKKLSEIEIDADKDWLGHQIEGPGDVDGVDVGSHQHSGTPGQGQKLDGANCLKDVDLDLGTGGLSTTKTIARTLIVGSCNLGRPPTNPPTIDIYGMTHAAEFTVNTDKAYYKMHVPGDWKPGTDIGVHIHWTRSSTGSDESGKTVKWQLKYLPIDGTSENCNSGESTISVQDTYDSSDAAKQIVYNTDGLTIPAAALTAEDFIIIEIMAITPTGTALTDPACIGLCFDWTAIQVEQA